MIGNIFSMSNILCFFYQRHDFFDTLEYLEKRLHIVSKTPKYYVFVLSSFKL